MRAVVPVSAALAALAASPFFACGTDYAAATVGNGISTLPLDGGPPIADDSSTPSGSDSSFLFDANLPTDGATFCTGSGPIIPVPGANTRCSGDLGATTFLFAVCSCGDVSVSGNLLTNSLPLDGGTLPGSGGSIGANGEVTTNSTLQVNGSVWAEGAGETAALHVQQASTITSDVHAGAAVEADQPLTIGGNLYANGNVSGSVTCNVADVPSTFTAPGLVADGGVVTTPVSVPAPCDCTNVLDIASIVSAFSGPQANTDALAGLSPSSFSPFPSTPVTLPCGQYYFDGVGGNPVNVTIDGRAAVFVNGDFDGRQGLILSLVPGAELDLFVSGDLYLGDATLGSSDSPARVRVYVGGEMLNLSGTATIGANIYAPNANVALSSNFEMRGSLFVGSLQLSGAFTIQYDESILSTAGCSQGGGSCSSCHDCSGATPACIGDKCAPCQTDSDCCAPLHCAGGRCYDQIP